MKFECPYWYDLHAHFRQGSIVPHLIHDHLKMGCAGILAMPNTNPPLSRVLKTDEQDGADSIESYMHVLQSSGGDAFQSIIIPLYLTVDTTADMIEAGAKSGLLKACKYYPPHGTTGAQYGAPLDTYIQNGVFQAMQDHGIVLCIHGEEHALSGSDYFDQMHNAETKFYRDRLPTVTKKFPNLKIVCEHVTTAVAVEFVQSSSEKVGATITPQHLLYTVGHLVQGLKYHLFCLPLLKFDEDRQALRDAVTSSENTKFFAGTDSAPHTDKVHNCGCAAGCYTGGIAPQLYVQAFEEAGLNMSEKRSQDTFIQFLSLNGARYYGLPASDRQFTLSKTEQQVHCLKFDNQIVEPLPIGLRSDKDSKITIPWSIEGI